ncbi:polyadenylate-binding protein-interacting protein 2 isoform X1 [Nilaparvata lugens]|nr:polyadenylate-binding protein-interacting protein 2 isoform X1 [Nilaparvata lugens]
MKMKIPTNSSGNGYYGSETIPPYLSDGSENGHQDDLDSPALDGDFSEYMWMENEEEFDKQVMQQLEEEELMEQCIQAMLEDERDIRSNNQYNSSQQNNSTHAQNQSQSRQQVPRVSARQTWSNGSLNGQQDICNGMENLRVQDQDELAKQSTLNPNAAEFVPRVSANVAAPSPSPAAAAAEKAA